MIDPSGVRRVGITARKGNARDEGTSDVEYGFGGIRRQ
jgi:hypothetical protein